MQSLQTTSGNGTTVVQVHQLPALGFDHAVVRCPHCAQDVTTEVTYHKGTCMWITALVVFFLCVSTLFLVTCTRSLRFVTCKHLVPLTPLPVSVNFVCTHESANT